MKCRHNGYYFILGILNTVSIILLSTALGTNKWIEGNIVRTVLQSNSNLTDGTLFEAGYKYMGLFRGCEEKKYGHFFQARSRCFNALDEFQQVSRADLAYISLTTSCTSVALLVISVYLSFYNELVRSTSSLLQVKVPIFVFGLIVILNGMSYGSFVYLYVHYLKNSLLNANDIKDGFSTENRSKLGYSFWLLIASSFASLLSLVILIMGLLRRGKTKFSFGKRPRNDQVFEMRQKQADGPVMMMY